MYSKLCLCGFRGLGAIVSSSVGQIAGSFLRNSSISRDLSWSIAGGETLLKRAEGEGIPCRPAGSLVLSLGVELWYHPVGLKQMVIEATEKTLCFFVIVEGGEVLWMLLPTVSVNRGRLAGKAHTFSAERKTFCFFLKNTVFFFQSLGSLNNSYPYQVYFGEVILSFLHIVEITCLKLLPLNLDIYFLSFLFIIIIFSL